MVGTMSRRITELMEMEEGGEETDRRCAIRAPRSCPMRITGAVEEESVVEVEV